MSVVHHVFGGERLQAFSDAVFAIVATIMVIPLKLDSDEVNENFVLEQYLYNQYPKYFIYVFSFILVVDTWYSHARIFSIVEQVDDVILWLNLLLLLFVSFLPYSIGLISRFQDSMPKGFDVAVSTCSIVVVLTGVTMMVMLLYAFRKQALLHPEMAGNTEIRSLKVGLLITLSVNPVLAAVAQLFVYFHNTQRVSLAFFYAMGITSLVVRAILHFYHRRKLDTLPDFAATLFRTVASKTRTEAFSDGLFSIVATLVVLDFTTEIPSSDDVHNTHHGDLKKALAEKRFIYLAYVASFCTVGLLWFVQYGMFQFLKKITPVLSFINTLNLCLVCGIPFVSEIYVTFANEETTEAPYYTRENELMAIRTSVVLIFLVGVSQLVFWTAALLSKSECLCEEIDRHPAELLMFIKIMVFPTVSGLVFFLTFLNQLSLKHTYGAIVAVTPFLFLLAKAGFSLHNRCRRVTQQVASVTNRLIPRNGRDNTPFMDRQQDAKHHRPTISSPINTVNIVVPEEVPLKSANT